MVTIWNEFKHEVEHEEVRQLYPEGIHFALAKALESSVHRLKCRTATLEEPEHGLTQEVLTDTDVLIWWGHKAHDKVEDRIVERVYREVLNGMGLIVLHSGHFSKIFKRLMGTHCSLKWREADERERLWNLAPTHPIMSGIGPYFELDREEMYGERFDIPEPEELLMVSWFQGGEVFRSACTWRRGNGRIFYFRPGHETYPTYYNENVQRILANACVWATPSIRRDESNAPETMALEEVPNASKTSII